MVLKKSKYGGNTGNTLRRNISGSFQYTKTSGYMFIKTNQDLTNQDGNINRSLVNVAHSLNKKKQWESSKILRQEIRQTVSNKKISNDYPKQIPEVALIVQDKQEWMFGSHRRSNVVMYMDTKGQYQSSNSTKPNISDNNLYNADIVYTFQEHGGKSLWPHYQKELFGRNIEYQGRKNINVNVPNRNQTKNYSNHFCHSEDLIQCSDEEYNNDIYDNDDDATYDKHQKDHIHKFNLEDLIKINSKKKQKLRKRKKLPPWKTTENRKLVIIEASSKLGQQDSISPENKKLQWTSFNCYLNKCSIEKHHLKEQYGDLYVEGQLFPRRFMILKEYTTSSSFILVTILEDVDSYSVCATISYDGSKITHNPLLVKNIGVDLDLIIEDLLGSQTLISESSIKKHQDESYDPFYLLKTTAQIISQEDAFKLCVFYATLEHNNNNSHKTNNNNGICTICYNGETEISLLSCGHMFCKSCLKYFVTSKVNSGNIFCPEYKCENKLDPVTVASFTSPTDYYFYLDKSIDVWVQRNPLLSYCPSPNCSSIARIEDPVEGINNKDIFSKHTPIAHCTKCSVKWCFMCKQHPHWPLTCDAVAPYYKKKKEIIGHLLDRYGNIYNTSIEGKKCPFCKTFIEKNGGCNVMICSCEPSRSFCWQCLQPFSDHNYKNCQSSKSSTIEFSSLQVDKWFGKRLKLVLRALIMHTNLSSKKAQTVSYFESFE